MPQLQLWQQFLLPAYLVAEATRALLTFSAVQSHIPVSLVFVAFLAELTKLAYSLFFAARWSNFDLCTLAERLRFSEEIRSYLAICIPAVLYLVNTFLYMTALGLSTPSFVHVAMLAKIPITAVLHHFLVRRQTSTYSWISLAFMTLGMIIFNLPAKYISMLMGTQTSGLAERDEAVTNVTGLCIGLAIALISGITSTYTEIILKQNIAFWVAQTWLYAFGSLAAGMVYIFWDGFNRVGDESTSNFDTIMVHVGLVLTAAGTGLIIANILRKQDNLVKIVGTSGSIVVIVVAEYLLYPSLRATTLNLQTGFSVTVIAVSTWAYSHYKQSATSRKIDPIEEEAMMEEGEMSSEDEMSEMGGISAEKQNILV